MTRRPPKYVHVEVDRHGRQRVYFRRRGGTRTALPPLDDPDFERAYRAALGEPAAAAPEPAKWVPPAPKTLRWLCSAYFESRPFRELDERTRYVRRRVIEHCLAEPTEPGAKTTFADFPLARLSPKAIRVLRDRKEGPEAANVRVKAFRQIFAWAIEAEVSDDLRANHARDVAYRPSRGDGFHAWTIDEVQQFERVHPIGTVARLAFALMLYTGQRRSDIVTFGRQHVRDGWLRFTQFKGRHRSPTRLEIPIIPELARIIEASPTGDLTFVVTTFGHPFTRNGFGNRMRKWCDEAGLPDCSSHGLRKAATARLAELGCTDREIMAITGHRTTKEVDRYARGARQRKLAENVLTRFHDAE